MDRRSFLSAGFSVLAYPGLARTQPANKVLRLGLLSGGSVESQRTYLGCFQNALREYGWIEGQNMVIEYRWSGGVVDRLPRQAEELIASKSDLFVATSTPGAQAMKRVAGKTPIVFVAVSDPVASGIVSSLSHPGENITGVSNFLPATSGKLLELLRVLIPNASRIAVLGNPSNAGKAIEFRELEAAGHALGLSTVAFEVRKAEDLDGALSAITRASPDALVTLLDGVTMAGRDRIARAASDVRLPTMFQVREFVEVGGLLSYGLNYCDHYRRAGYYVDRILKGARPGDLPVEQPTKFELVINMRTARALGVTIPQSLLLRADDVIR